jgi:tetratricopeptide (TPR) repeat protein
MLSNSWSKERDLIMKKLNEIEADEYLRRGEAYVRSGNHKNAIVALTKAIELRGHDRLEDYFLRGGAYFCDKNFPGAIKDLTKLIELRNTEIGDDYVWRGTPGKDFNKWLNEQPEKSLDETLAEVFAMEEEDVANGVFAETADA